MESTAKRYRMQKQRNWARNDREREADAAAVEEVARLEREMIAKEKADTAATRSRATGARKDREESRAAAVRNRATGARKDRERESRCSRS